MKNWILRASTAAFLAGLAGVVGCGSGSSNINGNTSTGPSGMVCGQGTYLNQSTWQCLPR